LPPRKRHRWIARDPLRDQTECLRGRARVSMGTGLERERGDVVGIVELVLPESRLPLRLPVDAMGLRLTLTSEETEAVLQGSRVQLALARRGRPRILELDRVPDHREAGGSHSSGPLEAERRRAGPQRVEA